MFNHGDVVGLRCNCRVNFTCRSLKQLLVSSGVLDRGQQEVSWADLGKTRPETNPNMNDSSA
jgi:hypothetical protein